MTLKELKEKVDFYYEMNEQYHDLLVCIPNNKHGYGGTQVTNVKNVNKGFDLDRGKLLLSPEKPMIERTYSVINWVEFDFDKIETRPPKYGKYLITRKDGKIHWETWNGSGWAYNHNEIKYWTEINPPF